VQNIFSDSGLSPVFFLEISALFVLTLAFCFDQTVYRKHPWFHHNFFGLLVVWWVIALISQTLATRVYATVMLLSVIVMEAGVRRKRSKLP
jgi:hypothetical protein